ncbi:MAG: toll/interleukin-1 receptor domain-containing protein [Chitinophagaceae bacterium]|nr:toll/interleukin-1 receptor domain-containing protein [Chitinophagaceae bacterium]
MSVLNTRLAVYTGPVYPVVSAAFLMGKCPKVPKCPIFNDFFAWLYFGCQLLLMRQVAPKKIFISHASPADNYFTAWLSSKLKILGYEVWVELDELKSGDAFWPEIEDAIRNQSCKFLVIISKSYLDKIKDPTSGVFKELSCADRIKDLKGFKSPIKLDETSEDSYPVQLMGLNSIDFFNNWQVGLDRLLESFEKEKIERNEEQNSSPLNFWMEALKIEGLVNSNSETIYTNWFPFSLPEKIIYQQTFNQEQTRSAGYPVFFSGI